MRLSAPHRLLLREATNIAAAGVVALLAAGCTTGGAGTDLPDLMAVGLIYSFKTNPVHLEAGTEIETGEAEHLPNQKPLWVTGFSAVSQPGLHHFRLDAPPSPQFSIYTVFSAPVNASNVVQTFPPGFAVAMIPLQPIWVSTHFVNATPMAQDFDLQIDIHTLADSAPPPIPMSNMGLITYNISLPPMKATDVPSTCSIPIDIDLHTMLSHTHHYGTGVDVYVVGGAHDGEMIYTTNVWDQPPMKPYAPPIHLEAGVSLSWTCHYFNPTTETVPYGALANQEMCGITGYYSPGYSPIFGMVAQEGEPTCIGATLQ